MHFKMQYIVQLSILLIIGHADKEKRCISCDIAMDHLQCSGTKEVATGKDSVIVISRGNHACTSNSKWELINIKHLTLYIKQIFRVESRAVDILRNYFTLRPNATRFNCKCFFNSNNITIVYEGQLLCLKL